MSWATQPPFPAIGSTWPSATNAEGLVSDLTGAPLTASYSRYAALELRSNDSWNNGNTVSGTPVTTYYKFEFDTAFDSAQAILISKVFSGTPGTYKAALAVTDEPRINTQLNAYLPQQGGVLYNVIGGKGWQPVTFGGAATKTIGLTTPADSGLPNNSAISLASDILQLVSIARNDGKTGGLLLMKITCLNGAWTQEAGSNSVWDSSAGQPFYRVRSLNSLNGDAIATPSIVPADPYSSGYGMMGGAQVHTTTRAELNLNCGDSRNVDAFESFEFGSKNVQSWMPLSTPARPLSIYNCAGSGHGQSSFTQVALDRIVNGGLRPTVIFYPGFSQNGFSNAANYKAIMNNFMSTVLAVPGMSNVIFVLGTDYYVNGYAGTQAEVERQSCITYAKSLANGSTILVFDSDAIMTDYSNPNAPTNVAAYMVGGDAIHAGPAGISAMVNGLPGKPGLQSVYKKVLGIA